MNYIRDNKISTTPIKWNFYKIFINLDKNKISELAKYIDEHNKSDRNKHLEKEFHSSFTSFQSYLCSKN